MKANHDRPARAVFADGRNRTGPLAMRPSAIGSSYATRKAENIADMVGSVAVLSIDGPLEHKRESFWSYWQTYEDLVTSFKCLIDDPKVTAIVLKFDSPGGEVSGLNETVAIMTKMKEASGKPVIGYVDEACYSAAYALSTVCDELFLPDSGGVGSIGVITTMADCVERDKKEGFNVHVLATGSHKTDNHQHHPLSDKALARGQKSIDKLAKKFFEMVSSARGLTSEAVESYQAGIFSGQAGVDAGLADGVMSLSECLTLASEQFSSPTGPIDRSAEKESKNMSGQIKAAKALNDANAAMAAAKTDADRALCAARIVTAEKDLAKITKTKTKDTTTHTEEVDDGSESEDESEDDSSSSGSSSSGSDDSEESESESEDESEEEKASASMSDSAKTGLHTKDRLLRLCRQIVGSSTRGKVGASHNGKKKMSIEEVMGALHATWQSQKNHGELAAKVKKLEATVESDKVKALVASGMKAGKIAPSQKDWARSQSPAALKAYLDNAPRLVATIEGELTEARPGANAGGVTAEMAKIWGKQGFTEKDFPGLLAAMNKNKSNGAS